MWNTTIATLVVLGVAWAIERTLMWMFVAPVYAWGPVIRRETRRFPPFSAPVGEEVQVLHGSLQLVSSGKCLFRRNIEWILSTPFPLKGSIVWFGDEARVTHRLPIASTLLFATLLLICLLYTSPSPRDRS